jgi:hypothetical protein
MPGHIRSHRRSDKCLLSIDALLAHDFEGLIVGHGDPIPGAGHEALAAATSWLPTTAARLSARKAARPALFSPKPCG